MLIVSLMPVSVSAGTKKQSDADIMITPVSITGYVGGDSLNGGHSPKLRFSVKLPSRVSMEGLNFTIYTITNGSVSDSEKLEVSAISDKYYLFPQLGAGFDSEEGNTEIQQGNYLKLVDDGYNKDSLNGTYKVQKRTGDDADWDDWFISAVDPNGNEYSVDVAQNSTVTIREVSSSKTETIYENINSYTTPVVKSDDKTQDELNLSIETAQENAESGMAIAVEKENTSYNYTTNGKSELGLIGNDGSEDTAEIALLFDNLMLDSYSNNQIEEKVNIENFENYEMKYLDLVNTKDGNAVVTTNKKIDIYWPYPDGITQDDAEEICEFKILHFKDMDRDYTTNSSEPSVGEVETIIPEYTEYGLKFSTKSFSPYVLLWNITPFPENNVLKLETPEADLISFDDDNDNIVSTLSGASATTVSTTVTKVNSTTLVEAPLAEETTDKKKLGSLPDTGDEENVGLWTAIMLICTAGNGAIFAFRRRKII
jgi:LPXTG-motif cell wall-anchored protein